MNKKEENRIIEAEAKLRELIGGMKSVLVAYSGGVDSTVVAKIAAEELGNNMLAVIARSPSLAEQELEAAEVLSKKHAIPLRIIQTHEMENKDYQSNSSRRCYYCKTELYDKLSVIKREEGYEAVLDGANWDDKSDHRPGREAAKEHNVRSVLMEIGLRKTEVRELALRLGLPNHDKPASPCLASRVPYGTAVTPEVLKKIEASEAFLKKRFQLETLRVRYHGNLARIEVKGDDFLILSQHGKEIYKAFREIGFFYVTLDLLGFRSGSLNEMILSQKNKVKV